MHGEEQTEAELSCQDDVRQRVIISNGKKTRIPECITYLCVVYAEGLVVGVDVEDGGVGLLLAEPHLDLPSLPPYFQTHARTLWDSYLAIVNNTR